MVQVPYPSACEEPFAVLVCAAIPPERPGACARRGGMESYDRGVVTCNETKMICVLDIAIGCVNLNV